MTKRQPPASQIASAWLAAVYTSLARAALRGQLTEEDIAGIENRCLAEFMQPPDAHREIHDRPDRQIWWDAEIEVRKLLDAARQIRKDPP